MEKCRRILMCVRTVAKTIFIANSLKPALCLATVATMGWFIGGLIH